MAIHVYPDLRVEVRAPHGVGLNLVVQRVKKRASWIRKKQRYFETFLPPVPPRQYLPGETHRYLGKQYRLKVSPDGLRGVKLKGGYFNIHTDGNAMKGGARALLEAWYRARAKDVLGERLDACLPLMQKYEVAEPDMIVRRMKTSWGNCRSDGRITLNTDLIRIPKRYIDYVVTHELCHLIEQNHGPEFYYLLTSVMPDWRERREKLNWYTSR